MRELRLTSPYMTGADVSAIQSALNDAIGAGLAVDGEFGELTAAAVKKWRYAAGLQKWETSRMPARAQRVLLGQAKRTTAEIARAKMRAGSVKHEERHGENMRVAALAVAEAEIGVKEQPRNSNDGPRVREYQAVTGAYRAPWCASFVAWCFKRVGRNLRGFNTAYCPSYVASARASKNGLWVVKAADAKPGDLVLFDWQQNGESDHIGILASEVSARGAFTAIEGNTSTSDWSNGGQVMRRKRNTSQVTCFVRVSIKG